MSTLFIFCEHLYHVIKTTLIFLLFLYKFIVINDRMLEILNVLLELCEVALHQLNLNQDLSYLRKILEVNKLLIRRFLGVALLGFVLNLFDSFIDLVFELIKGFFDFFLHLRVNDSEVFKDALKILVARENQLEVGFNLSCLTLNQEIPAFSNGQICNDSLVKVIFHIFDLLSDLLFSNFLVLSHFDTFIVKEVVD